MQQSTVFKVLVTAVAAIASPAVASDKDANAVYERMAKSFSLLDPAGLNSVYAPNATYTPRVARFGHHDRATLINGMTGFQQQVKAKGGHVDIRFRLVERKRFGDLYVDHGFVRTSFSMEKGSPACVTNAKFMTVLAKQPNGDFAIVGDADSESPADEFDKARPVEGLKFDR